MTDNTPNIEKINDEIFDIIYESIDTETKLPTEQEMMSQFDISRATLRYILNPYEVNGIIISRQGSGRYAQFPDLGHQLQAMWSPFIKKNPSLLLDFHEIRSQLELVSLNMAMAKLLPDDIMKLHDITASMMQSAQKGKPFEDADRKFHTTLFECTGNVLFKQLLTAFWDLCEQTITWPANDDLVSVAQQHIDLLEAFACKDLDKASEILSKQLEESRNRLVLAILQL